MSIFLRRRRAVAGADFQFIVVLGDGYHDPEADPPTLTVAWPASGAGRTEYDLSLVRAPDRITSVSTDGRDLHIECATPPGASLRGQVEDCGGEVWIDGGAVYQGPARVVSLVSQSGPVAGVVTAVLRLAEPLPGGVQPIDSYTGAAGSITVLDAGAASDGFAFSVYGNSYEWLDGGSSARNIDISGAPSNATLASRIAAKLNAEGNGLTAVAVGAVVTITGLGDGEIELIDPPDGVLSAVSLTGATNAGAWRIRYLSWMGTIPSADVGETVVRRILWTLPWQRLAGGDSQALACVARGVIDVVLVPWDTGLTDEDLYALVPGWRAIVPQAQTSWKVQRDLALAQLEDLIRPRLKAGEHVDQLLAEQFRLGHALLTAARVLQGQESLGYDASAALDRYLDQAAKALDGCLTRLVWIDRNDDGQVGATEQDVSNRGIRRPARSNFLDPGFDRDGQVERGIEPWDDR